MWRVTYTKRDGNTVVEEISDIYSVGVDISYYSPANDEEIESITVERVK